MPFLKLRLKKYFIFFSPSLYHLHLDLKIAPLVLCSLICSSSLFFSLILYAFLASQVHPLSCDQFLFAANL